MRGILFISILLSVKSLLGQVDEVVLADTVRFISTVVSDLKSERMTQEAVRLNFDDCNIEYSRFFADNNWEIHEFWLVDLDEKKMQLVFDDKANSWLLRLVCENGDSKMQVTGSRFSPEMRTKTQLYSSEKEPLISIGNALFHAISNCKGLDRFKDR